MTNRLVKNFKTRCEGLSPTLFFFAICGNVTYATSILAESMDWPYLVTNASWLAGVDTSVEELTYTNGMIREWTDCVNRYACKWPKYGRQKT